MDEVSRRDSGQLPEARPASWWSGPWRAVRAVLSWLDRAVAVVLRLLAYGAH